MFISIIIENSKEDVLSNGKNEKKIIACYYCLGVKKDG
jgi:hypothetical protein